MWLFMALQAGAARHSARCSISLAHLSRQQLRSTASGTLLVPRARTDTGQRSFAINGPRTWTVCQPILEHQIRPSATSSVISRPTCFCSSLRCLLVGSAPFVRRRRDCLASSAPFTNIQTYLLTYSYQSGKQTGARYRDDVIKNPRETAIQISTKDKERKKKETINEWSLKILHKRR